MKYAAAYGSSFWFQLHSPGWWSRPSIPSRGAVRVWGAKGTINAATAGWNLLLLLPRSHLCHASACDHCQRPRGHWGGQRQKHRGAGGGGCQDGERRGADPHCFGPEVGRRVGGAGRVGEEGGREATSSSAQRP